MLKVDVGEDWIAAYMVIVEYGGKVDDNISSHVAGMFLLVPENS